MARVPVGDPLEGIAGANEAGFFEVTADELEGDRTAVCAQSRRARSRSGFPSCRTDR